MLPLANVTLKRHDVAFLSAVIASRGSEMAHALAMAAYAHDGAFRKDQRVDAAYLDPYIVHPIRNAIRVEVMLGDVLTPFDLRTTMIACLLHDTVEDASTRVVEFGNGNAAADPRAEALRVIRDEFGTEVADAVHRVSNPESFDTMTRIERDVAYLEHLFETVVPSRTAYVVKVSDIVDNAGSLKHSPASKRRERLARKYTQPVRVLADAAGIVGTGAARIEARLNQISEELAGMV